METLEQVLLIVLALMGASVAVAVIGLALIARSIRRLRVPPHAGYFATMHYVPLALVILLDLLDFGLDIFAAPVSWILLDRMGLPNLRNKAVIEALIPFTQPIPTFTLSWLAARLFNIGDEEFARFEQIARRRRGARLPPARRPARRVQIIDADDDEVER